MAKIINGKMVLNRKESEAMVQQLLCPNTENIGRREEFISDIGKVKHHDDGKGFSVEVLGFDTSFLEKVN